MKKPKYERMSDEVTGDCPLCGERPAYAWTVAGFDGYFDACDECSPTVCEEFMDEQEMPAPMDNEEVR